MNVRLVAENTAFIHGCDECGAKINPMSNYQTLIHKVTQEYKVICNLCRIKRLNKGVK